MYFLKKLDLMHESNRQNHNIPNENKDFTSHIPVAISVGEDSFEFEIRKNEKSKLFLVSGKQRVYLSDFDIMNIILHMNTEDQNWFLKQFIGLYNGNAEPFYLVIGHEKFQCYGIPSFPNGKQLMLFSDTSIDCDLFIALANFVFAKDSCWERMSNMEGFGKTTLLKFISLIAYYGSNCSKGRGFLKSISFPVNRSFRDAYIKVKGYKAFEGSNAQKKFDISLYM